MNKKLEKKPTIYGERWNFKSFVYVLEFCQEPDSHLSRGEISLELFALLDPIMRERKSKDDPMREASLKDVRKYSQTSSVKAISSTLTDGAKTFQSFPFDKIPNDFIDFIKRFKEESLFVFLTKIITIELSREKTREKENLKDLLDEIKSRDVEKVIIATLLDTVIRRDNRDAPNLPNDFWTTANFANNKTNTSKSIKEAVSKPKNRLWFNIRLLGVNSLPPYQFIFMSEKELKYYRLNQLRLFQELLGINLLEANIILSRTFALREDDVGFIILRHISEAEAKEIVERLKSLNIRAEMVVQKTFG